VLLTARNIPIDGRREPAGSGGSAGSAGPVGQGPAADPRGDRDQGD